MCDENSSKIYLNQVQEAFQASVPYQNPGHQCNGFLVPRDKLSKYPMLRDSFPCYLSSFFSQR
jgi:hypothetical protein